MVAEVFDFADELGPSKVIHVHEPSIGLKAVLVVDNVAKGPAIGGVRMASDVTTEECFRLARAMTFKNAAAGLPHGGGKCGALRRSENGQSRQGAAYPGAGLFAAHCGGLCVCAGHGDRRGVHGLGAR